MVPSFSTHKYAFLDNVVQHRLASEKWLGNSQSRSLEIKVGVKVNEYLLKGFCKLISSDCFMTPRKSLK